MLKFVVTLAALVIARSALSDESQNARIQLSVVPNEVFIEMDRANNFINFDFRIDNKLETDLTIQKIELEVLDQHDRIVQIKRIDTNGASPSINTLNVTTIKKGTTAFVFNPFFQFSSELAFKKLNYRFFMKGGVDYQESISVIPKRFLNSQALILPSTESLVVDDGHDFYSHHRRLDFSFPIIQELGISANFSRYASDLVVVDAQGHKFKTDGVQKTDWFGYGTDVRAPAGGIVVAAVNNIPENDTNFSGCELAFEKKDPAILSGNHVIIDHGDKTFSLLAHMQTGSVVVSVGDYINAGDHIGKVGISGCTGTVHLHHELRTRADFKTSEGLPSLFKNYTRFVGEKQKRVDRGVINTGDIIKSN